MTHNCTYTGSRVNPVATALSTGLFPLHKSAQRGHQVLNVWEKTVAALQATVEPYDFVNWIRPIQCTSVDSRKGEVLLEVPDASHARWLEENFLAKIQSTVALFADTQYEVRLVVTEAPIIAAVPTAAPDQTAANVVPAIAVKPPELVSRYIFDRFVDGPNNQFAFTATKAAAQRPGRQYNPLFLYGGVGLGKTHLLHAVGHEVLRTNPAARIVYVTSETFVNDLISAIRKDRMQQFRTRYRDACDVLLIDDIQFIAGKDRTQEEFFHLFNTLHSSHKQIVMTSDQLPRSIPDMEDRLKSRLEWGLIADIKPPGFETRVAILKRKAEEDRVDLPDDVAMLLGRHINRNVRELEGALMRLVANARIFESPITIGMTREVLGDLVSDDVRRVSADVILKTVAHEYRVGVSDLKGPRRQRNIVVPRQIAMHLMRELTDASLPQIGNAFGGRDHTTVINALKRVDSLRNADPELRSRVERLRRQLVS